MNDDTCGRTPEELDEARHSYAKGTLALRAIADETGSPSGRETPTKKGNIYMTDELPDEPVYITDEPEPCWYCDAAEMAVECSSMVCRYNC